MDGLSAAASVIAVIQISESTASLCSQYFTAVKNAKPDIERLQGELSNLKTVLEGAQQLLKDPNGARLQTLQALHDGLKGCYSQLTNLETKLEKKLNPGKTGNMMSRFGLRALKWPFESKDVDNIIQTLKQFQNTLSAGLSIDQAAEVLDISQKLDLSKLPIAKDAAFNSHAHEHDARCHPDTRVELLEQIKEWAKNPCGQCIFWLQGMAGTGKSTISHTVAQWFQDHELLGASFFFKRGEADRGNASRFFTTISVQLVAKDTVLAASVQAAIEADPAVSNKTFKEQFEKLILEPLGRLTGDPDKPKTVVMVIDALDECENERDAKNIIYLLSRTKALTLLNLRIFVTSRPDLHIRLGFDKIRGNYQDIILHKIPHHIIKHDIAAFLEYELAGIMKEYNNSVGQDRQLPSNWPDQATVKVLVDMAVPLFIFAATVCRFINDRRLGSPEQQLQKVLAYQTKTTESEMDKLDATYRPILDQLVFGLTYTAKRRQIEEFRDVVGSIVLLAEPLSTSSLARLLDIPRPTIDSRLEYLHSVLSVPLSTDSPVRMLHLSFRDFLVDSDKRETNPFWVDERECHMRIANRCLQILDLSGHLKRDICDLEKPGKMRMEVDSDIIYTHLPAHVRYACQYWVHHLEQSHSSIRDGDHTHLFLIHHFLHWLEALSFIGKISIGISLINTLQSLIAKDKSTQISRFLYDAKCFILQNQGIADIAPLQLYSSAIIFAPETSIIRHTFKDQFPRWICKLPKMQLTWDPRLQKLEGHTLMVRSVAFSPDSQLLASGSFDQTVRLWNPATGEQLQKLEGHTGWVMSVAFSPDGQLLASGSRDETVRLWNPATGEQLQKLEGHTSVVLSVAFSPDGQLLASGSDDKTVRLWNPASGEQLQNLEVGVVVGMVSFSPRGPFLETDRGFLKVDCYTPLVSPQTDPITEIFVTKQWVTRDLKKLLWLPSEYRPTCSAFQSNVLVLGCSSGQLIFLQFNPLFSIS